MKHRWLGIALITVAVLFVIILVLPLLINVNSYRPKIESEASSALGRQVTVGNLSLALFSGTVTADNVVIADDPAFSKSPFLTAKSLKIGVELMPLIFSKELKITEIVPGEAANHTAQSCQRDLELLHHGRAFIQEDGRA
jgi:AsmA protein